ncbi:unnamed protein product [Rodentolepis nana]|uniref:Exophilin-5 n=1 Tax=Rodentolepis nana TaxID=102285 RepID=A0A158QHH6_RODNA|nr:unnamed protein product [Rodentolepis nana]
MKPLILLSYRPKKAPHCPWRGIHQFPSEKDRPTSSLNYYEKSRSFTDPVVPYHPPSFADLNTSQCLNDGYEISPMASEVSFSNVSEVYDETPYKVWRNPFHHRGRFSHSERPLVHSNPAVNRTSYNNQTSLSDRTSGFQSKESPDWQFSLFSTNSYGGCSSRFGDLIQPMPNSASQTWYQPTQKNHPTTLSQTHYSQNDQDSFPFRSKNSKFSRSNQDKVTSSTDRLYDNDVDESMIVTSSEWRGSNLSNSLINYITQDWSPVNIEQENARTRDKSRCASSQTDKTSLVSTSSQTDDRLFVCTVCRNRQDALARHPPTSNKFSQRPTNFGRLFASAQIPQNHSPTINQKADIELGKGYKFTSHLSPSEHFLCKSLDLSFLNED